MQGVAQRQAAWAFTLKTTDCHKRAKPYLLLTLSFLTLILSFIPKALKRIREHLLRPPLCPIIYKKESQNHQTAE